MQHKSQETISALDKFISEFIDKKGVSPTMDEIADGTGIAKTTVHRYLTYMRENGMLDYAGHRNIVTKEAQKTRMQSIRVPVLGSVSCGVPKLAEENIEEYVRLPVSLFGQGNF